jgi:hypothetical protein
LPTAGNFARGRLMILDMVVSAPQVGTMGAGL